MDKFIIEGGARLRGDVHISGAKNAALPILAACILATKPVTIHNVPKLRDIFTLIKLLGCMGLPMQYDTDQRIVSMEAPEEVRDEAPYDLIKTMRASFVVMGPLLARLKRARVALPGGCAIGTRPVDIHLKGFEALGAKIEIGAGYVEAVADRLRGARVYLDYPSVGATQNIVMAACLAEGKSVIENAAREPEIDDLIAFLQTMGADIRGVGTNTIEVHGVSELGGGSHTVIPDRIEAGTFISATAMNQGQTRIIGTRIDHLESILAKFHEAGVDFFFRSNDTLEVTAPKRLRAINVKTLPYPGFPTDMQAQMMALMTTANGTSLITETVFENRFMHVAEFKRMGANVSIKNQMTIVEGVEHLSGAPVMSSDLRAGAAMVIAGLNAHGRTEVSRVYHIDRGYEKLEDKLQLLGASIHRESE